MATYDQLEQQLQRWVEAGLLDAQSAGRIREFEVARETPGMRWPVVFAIAFGSIMVAAGVLLFIAAHWDELAPTGRFLIVLAAIAGFHLAAGALMTRMRALGLALHAVGTVALGGGIFLAGQIFNLQEHWPGGILLWAIGSVLTWLLLRDWLQATLAALLIPAWIACEWSLRAERFGSAERILVQFLTLVAITYLSARRGNDDSHFRQALVWAGGIAVLPMSALLAAGEWASYGPLRPPISFSLQVVGWLVAYALPLFVAWLLRGKSVLWNVGFALWVLVVGLLDCRNRSQSLAIYGLCALAAILLVVWGLQEQRRERINLGVVGFGLTILVFYFSNVMDKLGRSASLVGFGLLFLLGGWQLEKLRRKLVKRAIVGRAAS